MPMLKKGHIVVRNLIGGFEQMRDLTLKHNVRSDGLRTSIRRCKLTAQERYHDWFTCNGQTMSYHYTTG